MPQPIEVVSERSFSGTPRRIYQLLSDLGTSQDVLWPFPAQPFMRTAGPLEPERTEEWHGPFHAVLESAEPERAIVWRIVTEGIEGTHRFDLVPNAKRVTVRHRIAATLADDERRMLWRRYEETHERAIAGLFDKLARVLKR